VTQAGFWIKAQFFGKCPGCKGDIHIGDLVYYAIKACLTLCRTCGKEYEDEHSETKPLF